MACENQEYKLGRGRVYFRRQGENDYRYIGNTPEFNLTISTENLDHYCSDGGVKEKDDSIALTTERTGSLITDNIVPENVALFFFGTASKVTTTAQVGVTEQIVGVMKGYSYKIGETASNPTGVFGIDPTTFVLQVGGANKTAGTDYELDAVNGVVTILQGGTINDGDTIDLTYDILASTRDRVISGANPVSGSMMYIEDNPKGKNFTYIMPSVRVSPNGDYALKGEEWQQIPLNIEILKDGAKEAIYVDGNPV